MSARRFFVPEVVQTSAMDCGPATLKALLEGFGVHVSYGRLREACQTNVDGTSIDVMEEVLRQLGLDAEQTIVPLDHLLLAETDALPAIVVVRNPEGNLHFVVVWRRHGAFVQVMDPACGRRWMRADALLASALEHALPLDATTWRAWAGSDAFAGALRRRLRALGAAAVGDRLLARALADPTWRSIATLDAATRMTAAFAKAGGVVAGADAAALLAASFEQTLADRDDEAPLVPHVYWSAGPAPVEDGAAPLADDDPARRVVVLGAVIVRVRGRVADVEVGDASDEDAPPPPLPRELAAALEEPPARPLRTVVRLLAEDGLLTPALVLGATVAAAAGGAVEALALRGTLGVVLHLAAFGERAAALAALVVLFACLAGLELPIVAHTLRMGRKLELRLREAFLAKLPRIGDRYFASRPTSDMSHRAHAIHAARALPALGFRVVRTAAEMLVAAAGLVWLDRASLPYVVAVVAVCVALPFATQRALTERDRRVRSFQGALARFYLDALLGLVALRTHGAARALRREHETMLGELRRGFFALLSTSVAVDALVAFVSAAMSVLLLAQYLARAADPAGALLLVYWSLSLPALGAGLAGALRQYPAMRNLTERLLEPLGALEDEEAGDDTTPSSPSAAAVSIAFEDVTLRAMGKTILEGVSLDVAPGSHVAVVGPSGAGKSSLCGLLLGWHRPAEGRVVVDGAPLAGARVAALRKATAWVDPAAQLWNRTLLENVEYGSAEPGGALAAVLDAADLVGLLQRLPDGLQTRLGDGGALVSGGEGQRVRLARAMRKEGSRLVVLDEPFRGLDRERRRALLARARALWAESTLLCVTHDVGDTVDFGRVLVIEDGRVVEDGAPRALAADLGSRYRAMLDAEERVREGIWRGAGWRRLALEDGVVVERAP